MASDRRDRNPPLCTQAGLSEGIASPPAVPSLRVRIFSPGHALSPKFASDGSRQPRIDTGPRPVGIVGQYLTKSIGFWAKRARRWVVSGRVPLSALGI